MQFRNGDETYEAIKADGMTIEELKQYRGFIPNEAAA
jgi:hypothetical protein